METILAVIGGALIGQFGTFITHILSLHRDRQKAKIEQEVSDKKWEREERAREAERKHQNLMHFQNRVEENQKEIRRASEDLLKLAHRTLHAEAAWPLQNSIQDALAKVRALTGPRSRVSIEAYLLADVVSSMLTHGTRGGDRVSDQAANWGMIEVIDKRIERFQESIELIPQDTAQEIQER